MDWEDELVRLAFAEFPNAGRVSVGLSPDPWIRVSRGSMSGEVHIPRSTAQEQWVSEFKLQFVKLKETLDA